MDRQVILLEDLIDVFAEEIGQVLEGGTSWVPGGPRLLGGGHVPLLAPSLLERRGIPATICPDPDLASEVEEETGLVESVLDQSTFSWFKNHWASRVQMAVGGVVGIPVSQDLNRVLGR